MTINRFTPRFVTTPQELSGTNKQECNLMVFADDDNNTETERGQE